MTSTRASNARAPRHAPVAMSRLINFSPGPATLPLSVLEEVQSELVDYHGSGISMLEHSHRGKEYSAVHEETTALVKELLSVPDTHDVLFMQGGATGQFALVPMNFLGGASADYDFLVAHANETDRAGRPPPRPANPG